MLANNDIAKIVFDFINAIIISIGGGEDAPEGATAAAEDNYVAMLAETIKALLPYVKTQNGLTIDITDDTIGKVFVKVAKLWDSTVDNQNDFINGIISSDTDGIITAISALVELSGCRYSDGWGLLDELLDSNASISIKLGDEGVSLDLDVDVNSRCGISLSIEVGAAPLGEIKELGKGVCESGYGWYYHAF